MSEKVSRKELARSGNDAINALRTTLYSQELSANRNLQVLNAGGTVALLAFLGQTWESAEELRAILVIVIACMVTGLCLAVWGGFQLPAYTEWGFRQNDSSVATDRYMRIRRRYLWINRLSFLAFTLAVAFLLIWLVTLS